MIMKNPKVCPPKSRLPPEVAYPIGKVVCEAKSRIVVKNGKILIPINAADIQMIQNSLD